MNTFIWNPWHGCIKYSEGCQNCYVYRRDESIGKDASQVTKNADFNLPVRKSRNGDYKIPRGSTVFCCMTSDFFLDKADEWRNECWDMMRLRNDVNFIIITKRILRFSECIPHDWNDGWDNVSIFCTVENQKQADARLGVFLNSPIKHRRIICEPLLGAIDIEKYLSDKIEGVVAGGESGNNARICDFEWVTDLRYQCKKQGVPFSFKQTGARFRYKNKIYDIPRSKQHIQAKKAGIDY